MKEQICGQRRLFVYQISIWVFALLKRRCSSHSQHIQPLIQIHVSRPSRLWPLLARCLVCDCELLLMNQSAAEEKASESFCFSVLIEYETDREICTPTRDQ